MQEFEQLMKPKKVKTDSASVESNDTADEAEPETVEAAKEEETSTTSALAPSTENKEETPPNAEEVEESEKVVFTFPERLMELLDDAVEKESMWWLEDGNGFCVVPKLFAENVLNKYFQGTKFESFTRKLNRW
jgi:hypothetical protein